MRNDLTLAHTEHLAAALDKIMDARFQTPFTTLASLSLVCEQIASALSDAQHIQTGAEPRKLSEQLPAQAAHFRQLAEQAIRSLDPGCYDESIEHAVAEMVNGEFTRHMNAEEKARETISVFLCHFAKPLVTTPAIEKLDAAHVEIEGTRFYFRFEADGSVFWHHRPTPTCPGCGEEFPFFAKLRVVFDGNGNPEMVACPACFVVMQVKR